MVLNGVNVLDIYFLCLGIYYMFAYHTMISDTCVFGLYV